MTKRSQKASKAERRTTLVLRMCKARGVVVGVRACAKGRESKGCYEAVLTAVEAARVPGMPRGGGVGSNEFE